MLGKPICRGVGSQGQVNRLPDGSNKGRRRGGPLQQETTMKKFIIAAIAALSLSASLGSAYAAVTSNPSVDSWVNNKPPAFVYSPAQG